jgi:hypothetical protein
VVGPRTRYRDHHPGPDEIALVVEVADSTLAQDRDLKARAYANSNLAVYWIVNLVDRQVEVYTDPTGPAGQAGYRQRQDLPVGTSVPVQVGGQVVGTIAVQELLP